MMHRRQPFLLLAHLAALLVPLLASAGYAQELAVPREFLEDRRRLAGDQIAFCINVHSPTADFDRAVSTAVAEAILLEPTFVDVDPPHATVPMDYRLTLTLEQLFVFLTDRCAAYAGSILTSSGYPDWLTLSRAYYTTTYVLATTNPSFMSLRDVPPGHRIGTRQLSSADIALSTYMRSLPEGRRWQRSPYPYDQLLVERLLDGTIDVAFVWEPVLHRILEGDPAAKGVRVIPTNPVNPRELSFGFALRQREVFIRTLLDEAIVALIEDGTVDALLEEYALPGRPGALGR